MDKRAFLDRLQRQLADLTVEERREALEYYEEYFADAGEENEADVILSLGTPEQVAEQIKAGLHKEEKGMFTENGYREKVESDNPPDVYGKKAERQKSGGPHPWERGKQKNTGYQNTSDSRGQQAEKRKGGMSGGMIALLVILGIFASPVILGLGAALLGVVLGIFGAVLGVLAAIFAVVIALLAAGAALFFGGFPMLIYHPFSGMLCIAAGCFLIALFLVCVVLLVSIFGRFFPWLIREVESFGKYLSRKWAERRGKGEAV